MQDFHVWRPLRARNFDSEVVFVALTRNYDCSMIRRAGLRSPSLHIISNWDAAGISTGHLHKIHLQLFVVDMHNVNYFPGGATIPVATVQYFHAFPSSWRTRWRAIFVTRPCKYCETRVAPHFSSSYRHGFSKPNRRSHFVLRFPLFLVAS